MRHRWVSAKAWRAKAATAPKGRSAWRLHLTRSDAAMQGQGATRGKCEGDCSCGDSKARVVSAMFRVPSRQVLSSTRACPEGLCAHQGESL